LYLLKNRPGLKFEKVEEISQVTIKTVKKNVSEGIVWINKLFSNTRMNFNKLRREANSIFAPNLY
jgi:ribosomal protein S11